MIKHVCPFERTSAVPSARRLSFISGGVLSDSPGAHSATRMLPAGFNERVMHSYSITSSALASSDGGTVRPSVLSVFILITSSNLVGCSTGRSEGLVPLRTLST